MGCPQSRRKSEYPVTATDNPGYEAERPVSTTTAAADADASSSETTEKCHADVAKKISSTFSKSSSSSDKSESAVREKYSGTLGEAPTLAFKIMVETSWRATASLFLRLKNIRVSSDDEPNNQEIVSPNEITVDTSALEVTENQRQEPQKNTQDDVSNESNKNTKRDSMRKWVQLSGHVNALTPGENSTVLKRRDPDEIYEVRAYEAMMNDDNIAELVPTYFREVQKDGAYYLELEDLTHHFMEPHIMDIKMGMRTFLESEINNSKLRKDLYQKMIHIDPDEPTDAEREQEAITKLRYMQFRERESTTFTLGFRIEAIKMSEEDVAKDLKLVRDHSEVKELIAGYFRSNSVMLESTLSKLKAMRERLENSNFFKEHELIGSSLLFLYDDSGKSNVWMIDFAKTVRCQKTLSHTDSWVLGNHEDGYLIGLDNLTGIMKEIHAEVLEREDNLIF